MNKDEFKGQLRQLKGEIKQQWGKITEDDFTQIDGRRDVLEGKIQERYGKTKEEVRKELDSFLKKHPIKSSKRADHEHRAM